MIKPGVRQRIIRKPLSEDTNKEENMDANQTNQQGANRPNFLILCMDQWDTHMQVPEDVHFPAMQRLEARGVTFDHQYCTVPICTPSRATMWTGMHALHTGLWDNTNFAWITELSDQIPTIGHLLREQGYYTAFKGKWHLSEPPLSEDALERYGFADYQQWGEMFGAPLQGEMLDGVAAFETIDWLEHKTPRLDQPWLLVCSLVNPHDVMFLETDPIAAAPPNGIAGGIQTTVQRLGWFERQWDVPLPGNFADDYTHQPEGVRQYKEYVDQNFGRIPDERSDLWLKHRNYLINAMRLVDAEFARVLDALDRLDLWRNTVVLFTSDHGEMNGAHRLTQKGSITFDEATIVNLTVCVPGGPQGQRTAAVGSHLDLAPTLLEFTGLSEPDIHARYPHLKGRSLASAVRHPRQDGPRGSTNAPGDGALLCWDGLHALDNAWAAAGAVKACSNMSGEPWSIADREATLEEIGKRYGAPDFSTRTFFRTVVDGRYKLVRWFSPEEYANPSTLDELYTHADVALYDLEQDPGELENRADPNHPAHDPALIQRLLGKLHALVRGEIGDDRAPFSLDLFGTREVRPHREEPDTSRDGLASAGP
jgi:arylsulfatase A-like enzyme